MICNLCGLNQATIHLTEIINNQMVEIHICESCAQEKGTEFKTHFDVGDILSNFSDIGLLEEEAKKGKLKCSGCSITYDDFAKSGRLGCPECYQSFSKLLMPLIQRVQRASHHLGKKPKNIPTTTRNRHDLRQIQERLRKCIQMEQFEEAAKLRDEIKQIQEKQQKKTVKKKPS